MEGLTDSRLVLSLIAHALEAGANWRAARAFPRSAEIFEDLAREEGRQVRALADRIGREAARPCPGKAASPIQPSGSDGG